MKKIKIQNINHAYELARQGYFISTETHIDDGQGVLFDGNGFMYCYEKFTINEPLNAYFRDIAGLYAYKVGLSIILDEDNASIQEIDQMLEYFLKLKK